MSWGNQIRRLKAKDYIGRGNRRSSREQMKLIGLYSALMLWYVLVSHKSNNCWGASLECPLPSFIIIKLKRPDYCKLYFYTLQHVLSPLEADAVLGRSTRREGTHFYALYSHKVKAWLLTCCPSVLIPCHCQSKSTLIPFLVTRGVRSECPFTFKINLFDIRSFPVLLGGVILTTAVLNSRIKRKPDKAMSVFTQLNKASYFFLQKEAPKYFRQWEMSFIQLC